ncbi:Acyl-coenzyme A thioesterase 9, mitochondrial [Hypsibius exemplaris]|uniref:Acyl-coenzyme A thioesterase 9, mitochondrial n=1 Tax=Hypsibius exemplaris TaxID=2072580 RepID=A0A1W0WWY5_HYPEX|nr:Acyl-coenzyme A thioesterase 9, mitochondrial [Hypsibius exemplaris]
MVPLTRVVRSQFTVLVRFLHSSVIRRPAGLPNEIPTMKALREQMKRLVGASAAYGDAKVDHVFVEPLAKSQEELPAKRLYDSYDEALIPLRNDIGIREEYYNAFHHVRFGRLLEDLDMFAVWLTYKHAAATSKITEDSISPMAIVTGMVDRIDVETRQIPTDQDIRMRGLVTWVGESSAESLLLMEQERPGTDEWDKILEARFVLVARDPKHGRKAILPPLKPDGPDEEALHAASKANHRTRKQWQEESLFKLPPNQEETKIIHELFLQTVDPKESVFSTRTKPIDSVWLDEATLKNVHICHPQNRNIYGKVFGGFLMRNAFELAWSNAYMYCGSRPITMTVDDIKFRRPVDIGSLLLMSARLVYTEGPNMQMRVHAEVIDPATQKRETTNTFYFTFRDSTGKPVKRVIPKSYSDAMLYLTGRRHYGASKHYQRLIALTKPEFDATPTTAAVKRQA